MGLTLALVDHRSAVKVALLKYGCN